MTTPFKEKLEIAIGCAAALFVTFISIRLSGFQESLGILAIGLFFIDGGVVFMALFLRITKVIKSRTFLFLSVFVLFSYLVFIGYNFIFSY